MSEEVHSILSARCRGTARIRDSRKIGFMAGSEEKHFDIYELVLLGQPAGRFREWYNGLPKVYQSVVDERLTTVAGGSLGLSKMTSRSPIQELKISHPTKVRVYFVLADKISVILIDGGSTGEKKMVSPRTSPKPSRTGKATATTES